MAYKIWSITKEVLFVLLVLIILFSLVLTGLSYIPKSSTPFSVTLNAIKITDPGLPVDTLPITIEGNYKEFFQIGRSYKADQVVLNISSFDGFTDFESQGKESSPNAVGKIDSPEYGYILYYATKDGKPYYATINFSKDFQYWLINISSYDALQRKSTTYAYYACSTNPNDSLEEIQSHFSIKDFSKAWDDSKPEIDSKPVTEITHIDWDMHGTFLNTDGTTRPVDFLVTGTITTTKEAPNHNLKLQIYLPDDFTYRMVCPTTGFSSWNQQNHEMVDLYICQGNAVNKDAPPTKTTVFSYFALDVEMEYFVLMFQDAPGCYLVASTGDTSRQALLTYFQNFTQTYSSYIWRD